MADPSIKFTFSSKIQEHASTDLPSGWLEYERKSTIIAGKYLKIILLVITIIYL
jgi:hypothetical protein